MKTFIYRSLASVFCAVLLTSCATGPEVQNPSGDSPGSPDLMFSIPAGQANIFVHRDGQLSGAALTMSVFFDQVAVGKLNMGNSMEIQTQPGDHMLGISVGEMTRMTPISVEAGHNYFYRFHAGLTMLQEPKEIPESSGQDLIKSSGLRGIYQATTTSAIARLKREGGTMSKADAINVVQSFLAGGTANNGFTWDKASVTENGIFLHTTANAGIISQVVLPSTASGTAETTNRLGVADVPIEVVAKKDFFLDFANVAKIKTEATLINGDHLLFYDKNHSVLLNIPCGNKFPNFDILLPALKMLCPNAT